MWKMKKIVRAILERILKTIILQRLTRYNLRLNFFLEKTLCEFWDLMLYYLHKKIQEILEADSEKNCGLTNYQLLTMGVIL